MFIILIVVLVSQMFTHQTVTLNTYSLVYISYTSISCKTHKCTITYHFTPTRLQNIFYFIEV